MRERLYLSLLVAVLLCLAGWTAHAQLQRGGPARQAWEYKTWVLQIRAGGTTLYEDGNQLPRQASPLTRAPELGAQGWELVSVTCYGGQTTDTCVYWFKRPR